MSPLFIYVYFILLLLCEQAHCNKRFGSVRVIFEPTLDNKWPEGIKLVNNYQQISAPNRPRNVNSSSVATFQSSTRRIAPVRRTYIWQAEELIISFNMTAISNPTCTRLVPPVTWLSSSRAKVKVLHSGALEKPTRSVVDDTPAHKVEGGVSNDADIIKTSSLSGDDSNKEIDDDDDASSSSSSFVEVSVPREFAESSLSTLRMHGFARQDIYRMLDKGPWVLAFDISATLPKLFYGLQTDLGLNQTQAVHIVSHCPYLIAQYARYKGREVYTTFRALMDAGYTKEKLIDDIMRFPSMLAAPPERISGWSNLLQCFDVATDRGLFGKMLRRTPFMYYLNPPQIHDPDVSNDVVSNDISTTASGFVAYESLRVLRLLQERDFPDLDKIVRTQPSILLESVREVAARANFLLNLFTESQPYPSSSPSNQVVTNSGDRVPAEREYLSSNRRERTGIRKPKLVKTACDASVGVPAAPMELQWASQTVLHDPEVVPLDMNGIQKEQPGLVEVNEEEQQEEEEVVVEEEEVQWLAGLTDVERKAMQRSKAKEQLGALLLTYPAVLSVDYQQMRAACNALRKAGMRRWEVLQIARRHPPVLGRDPSALLNLVSFLRFYCGMKKADLLYFLNKYPAVLASDVEDIEPKVEYLFQSLGGSQEMLRRYPAFLSFDLEMHTRPRAEFLRAMGMDPLVNGLGFLVGQPAREIADLAGVKVELFNQFQMAYPEHIRKEKEKDALTDPLPKLLPKHFWKYDESRESPEDALFDDFDVGF